MTRFGRCLGWHVSVFAAIRRLIGQLLLQRSSSNSCWSGLWNQGILDYTGAEVFAIEPK